MFANETTCTSIYLNYKASSNINGKCISVYTIKKEEFIPNFVKFYLGQKLVRKDHHLCHYPGR